MNKMIIVANEPEKTAALRNAMGQGNCIVLYHRISCPYCVSLKPEWEKFKKLAQTIQGLTIGEVEGEHIDAIPEANISSVPTIKFYKSGPVNNNVVVKPEQPKAPRIINLIRNMIARNPAQTYSMNQQSNNEVVFQNNRTANDILKFAKDNLVINRTKALTSKAKKTKRVNKTTKRSTKNKTKKTKRRTVPMAAALAYNNAKANDTKIIKKLKKSIL
jgi:hypothetical protein